MHTTFRAPFPRLNSLLLIFLLSVILAGCSKPESQETKSERVRPIKLITVSEASSTKVNSFPAVIGATRLSELSFQVGGVLKELPVKEAERLEKGALIARLDQRDFKSSLQAAKAQYESAASEYRRASRLSKTGAIAATVLEQRETQFNVTKAQYDQAKKALSDSVLKAPFKGVVAKKFVKSLQAISPGQPVVNYMTDDLLEAKIDLPASFLANVPKNQTDKDRRKAFVILNNTPNQPIEAQFTEASLIADTVSQTYSVTFVFPSPDDFVVLPGMNATVEVHMEGDMQAPRVSVPLSAISGDGQDTYVWLVDEDTMQVSKQPVSIADGVGESAVITAGLRANDVIAGAGAAYLSEGMKVRAWE